MTPERFAPFGDVIHASRELVSTMNDARFDRFNDLARIDVDAAGRGRVAVGIARCKTPTVLPYRFDLVERHPRGSQAFIPLSRFAFVVVVGPPGESVEAADLCAFVTNGAQGINYHKGTWHMPLIALEGGQEFLIVDRTPREDNCEELVFSEPVTLEAP